MWKCYSPNPTIVELDTFEITRRLLQNGQKIVFLHTVCHELPAPEGDGGG